MVASSSQEPSDIKIGESGDAQKPILDNMDELMKEQVGSHRLTASYDMVKRDGRSQPDTEKVKAKIAYCAGERRIG